MAFANQRILLLMTDLRSSIDIGRTLRNRPATNDLASSVPAARIAFPTLLLTSQMAIKISSQRFINIDMFVDCLVANFELRRDLLWV